MIERDVLTVPTAFSGHLAIHIRAVTGRNDPAGWNCRLDRVKKRNESVNWKRWLRLPGWFALLVANLREVLQLRQECIELIVEIVECLPNRG
jgi:hypothetical protein